MEKLEELRLRINDVDEKIVLLLKERFDIAKEIGETKKDLGLDVENKGREEEVVKKVRDMLPGDLKDLAEEIYRTIIKTSKDYQKKL